MPSLFLLRSRPAAAFFAALGLATLLFLPFVIWDGGYFIYYGDFNVQQIPFYKLAHEAVRGGDIFWSFYTDLGANFIGSYSFYLLFSPFFWLTLPFPTHMLPLLMAPLLILKTACAALTAYLYLERFIRDRYYAVFCSLLYAFSGWMFFNIFFNHFHEAAVFFPLLLLGVEKLVTENRRGFFALAVLVNAAVNYWFFVGEVVFVLLYVLFRMTDRAWGMTPRKFCAVAFEAVLGVGMAAGALLPSVLAVMGNPRTTADNILTGWNLWIYWQEQNREAIVQSLFFPPELPARLNFFPEAGAEWSSRSAWLPLVNLSGVLAYFFSRGADWLKRLLALSFVMALIPGLNSLFILLNHSYYARWYYMPLLLMCAATARALEESRETPAHMERGLTWCLVAVVAFAAACGLTPVQIDGVWQVGLAANPVLLWANTVIALVCILYMKLLIARLREHRLFKRMLSLGLCVVCLTFGIFYLSHGKTNSEHSSFIIESVIGGRETVSLPTDGREFVRTDVHDGLDNLSMFWHRPTIQTFHSIVPPSVMEFYPAVGVTRDVGSRAGAEFFALRPLLSVRWLFIERQKEEQSPMPGYRFHSEQAGFNIYENENFIPMGFAYDEYLRRGELEDINEKHRSNLMLRFLILEDSAAPRYRDILAHAEPELPYDISGEAMAEHAAARRAQSCVSFTHDTRGFTAVSNLERENLLFFSVPWEAGWRASVNGVPAQIERVNIGFMAVRVPAGEARIRFDYETPGLWPGLAVSGGALCLYLLCLLLWHKGPAKAEQKALDVRRALFLGEAVSLSWEEYLRQYDRDARKRRLDDALREGVRLTRELASGDSTSEP